MYVKVKTVLKYYQRPIDCPYNNTAKRDNYEHIIKLHVSQRVTQATILRNVLMRLTFLLYVKREHKRQKFEFLITVCGGIQTCKLSDWKY